MLARPNDILHHELFSIKIGAGLSVFCRRHCQRSLPTRRRSFPGLALEPRGRQVVVDPLHQCVQGLRLLPPRLVLRPREHAVLLNQRAADPVELHDLAADVAEPEVPRLPHVALQDLRPHAEPVASHDAALVRAWPLPSRTRLLLHREEPSPFRHRAPPPGLAGENTREFFSVRLVQKLIYRLHDSWASRLFQSAGVKTGCDFSLFS